MKAWWGRLSLRARLASMFGAMAAASLIFLIALIAHTIGPTQLLQGKIIPAAIFILVMFFVGGWFVAGLCLEEISKLGLRINREQNEPLPSELEGLAVLLRREARKRDELLGDLRRFSQDIAHEMRRPVTAMRAAGELALRNRSTDAHALAETIGLILEEAEGLNNRLSRLLELARLETGETPITIARIKLFELLWDCRESLLVLAQDKEITVTLSFDFEIEVQSDATLLRTAILNLLHNAIKWSPPNTLVVVHLSKHASGETIIDVSDQGPGIAPENRERIFQRFFRGATQAGDKVGSGLGLCIARQCIERVGGFLTLRDHAGPGAAFQIRLPPQISSLKES